MSDEEKGRSYRIKAKLNAKKQHEIDHRDDIKKLLGVVVASGFIANYFQKPFLHCLAFSTAVEESLSLATGENPLLLRYLINDKSKQPDYNPSITEHMGRDQPSIAKKFDQ